jgi:hypothetical protein
VSSGGIGYLSLPRRLSQRAPSRRLWLPAAPLMNHGKWLSVYYVVIHHDLDTEGRGQFPCTRSVSRSRRLIGDYGSAGLPCGNGRQREQPASVWMYLSDLLVLITAAWILAERHVGNPCTSDAASANGRQNDCLDK